MWKKLLLLAGVVTVAAIVVKKVKAAGEERALWHEATTPAEDVR
ncbi:DLW-39 family protein [Phytomonospora sp. NPDC050363]